MSKSTVSRVLTRMGLSKLSDLEPTEPVARYQHDAPGDLLHLDTKKLGHIERPSHRVTGNRRDSVDGAGWEFLFVANDDHARIGFSDMYPDERHGSARQFLRNAVAYFASLGVRIKAVLTDNGPAFRSKEFNGLCAEAPLYPGLSPADQRQGRTLHPERPSRAGLWLHLPAIYPPH